MLDGELTFHLDGRFIFRRAEYQCSPWRGNVPVHPGYRTSSSVVGYLYRGGRANWFCRSASARSLAWDTSSNPASDPYPTLENRRMPTTISRDELHAAIDARGVTIVDALPPAPFEHGIEGWIAAGLPIDGPDSDERNDDAANRGAGADPQARAMQAPVRLIPLPDGPYQATGPLTISRADGASIAAPEPAYLCRCGRSDTKPFCDGSHARTGWKEDA